MPTIDDYNAQLVQLLQAPAAQHADLAEQLHATYLALALGGTTPGGYPYPDPTDPVASGADAIRALAEAADPMATKFADAATQNVGSGSGTALTFLSTPEIAGGGATLASGTDVTIVKAGTYLITGSCRFATNSTGYRILDIFVNGTFVERDSRSAVSGAETYSHTVTTKALAAGDKVQLQAFHNTGGTVPVGAKWVAIHRLG